jgi:hypothetical protein
VSDEQLHIRGFSTEDALVVKRIMMIGSTELCEHIGIEIETDEGKSQVLLFPFAFFQKLLLALLTAGGIAHRERRSHLGSDRDILNVDGFSSFKPTGHDVARVRLASGEDVVLMRMKKGTLPVIDITASVGDAKQLAADILAEAAKDAPRPQPRN